MSLTLNVYPLFSMCLQLHTYLKTLLNGDILHSKFFTFVLLSQPPQIIQIL